MQEENLFLSPGSDALRSDFPHSPGAGNATSETPTLIERLLNLVNEISSIVEYRKIFRTESANLVRRIRLLAPLFEELREFKGPLPDLSILSFISIERGLEAARGLLHSCCFSSKIYLVIEREFIASQFVSVTTELECALEDVPYNHLDISDEVREQIDLVRAQLKRAKERADAHDQDLYDDVAIVLSQESYKEVSSAAIIRLAERLNLRTLPEIRQETRALNRLIAGNGGGKSSNLGEMSMLLTRLKEFALNDMELVDHESENIETESLNTSLIPDDFRCPISLELMREPVIVATGQTFERASIQKWLDAGNKICPKTQQVLNHLILTPNYVLKSLIAQWCEMHGIELPLQDPSGERQTIEVLLQKLSLGEADVQRAAAGELRMLAKKNTENRICIAEVGAIPHLVKLLGSQDPRAQEHAVTALLNLSIYDGNKRAIIASGALRPIVEVLKNGSMEARENAAATLFSLSVVDENKVAIGASGAIPALVTLLCDGTLRGKKDAATALFNLAIYQGNKARAVRAHVIPPLMQLLQDPSSEMVDESLAILAILATHPEGRTAISQASAIPHLVNLIQSGSSRNKENAAAVLLALCSSDPVQLAVLRKLGAYGPLTELERNGTPRARRKAMSLLESMNKLEANNPREARALW